MLSEQQEKQQKQEKLVQILKHIMLELDETLDNPNLLSLNMIQVVM